MTLGSVLLASAALAADLTWDGGGSDAQWSTTNNWAGDASAPVADDALYFGGSARLANTNNLAADTSFGGITFNSGAGAFTLSGNSLTLGGDVRNLSASTQTLKLPMILSGTRMFYGSNAAVTVNGTLSGTGGLLANVTNSTLTLTGSNTYEGVTVVSNGTLLAISHGSALGSTNGNTMVRSTKGGWLQISGGIVVDEPLTFNEQRPNSGASLLNSGGSNTVRGLITTLNGMRMNASGGTTLVIAGGISGTSGDLILNPGGGTIIFSTAPVNLGSGGFWADQSGMEAIAVAGNVWNNTRAAGGTVRTDIANALPTTTTLYVGVGYQPNGIVDLNRSDQTIGALITDTTNAGTRTVTSPARATLTLNQSANTTYNGQLAGAVCLVKAGTGTITFTNAVSPTTGDITVSNGTLVVEYAAGFSASTNVVVAGGTLELRTATALADSASLSILDGTAKVKIGTNLTETVNTLFLGGVQQRRGTYGATAGSGATTLDTAHFSGSGKLSVLSNPPILATNYTWDAGGGADSNLTTAANWEGDALPAFTGTSYVFFASSGGAATVNTNASLYGLAFNRDGAFTLANGDGALTLGLGGLTAYAPTATSRAYTVAEDVTLIENQTWSVTNLSGATTLTVSGNIGDGADALGFTKTGNGTLVLSGTNTYDGVTTLWGGGITVASSNALGSTLGGTVVNTAGATSAHLDLPGGITLAEPLTFIGSSVNGGCLVNAAGTNTVSGPITTSGGRYVANAGTLLNITGGVTGPNPFFVVNAQGTVTFTAAPLNLGTGTFHTDSGGLTVLGVAGNSWGAALFTGGSLRTDVANAFPTNATLKIGGVWYGPNANLNLNGFDQTIGGLQRAEPSNGLVVITSVLPATLTVNQSANTTYDGQLAGAVSLVKTGTGSLTLSNALNSTVGNITVSNGTLVVFAATNLGNSTNVTVAATGAGTTTLSLQSSTCITNSATLTIANGNTAKVNLAAGVNETVGYLFFGNKQQRVGTYGAPGSGAYFIDSGHFAGTGILTVLHDKSGTLLRVQ